MKMKVLLPFGFLLILIALLPGVHAATTVNAPILPYTGGDSLTGWTGYVIRTNTTIITIKEICKDPAETAPRCYIFLNNTPYCASGCSWGVAMANASFVNNCCTVNAQLNASTAYRIVVGTDFTASHDRRYKAAVYPYFSSDIRFDWGLYNLNFDNTQGNSIYNITYELPAAPPTADNGVVDVLAWNDSKTYKATFSSINENWHVGTNYTNYSGIQITSGDCKVNISSAIDTHIQNMSPSTFYGSYFFINYSTNMNTTNVDYVIPSFRACYPQLTGETLTATVFCSSGRYTKVLTSADIVTCASVASLNYPFNEGIRYFVNTTTCKNDAVVNFSIVTSATVANKAINVSRLVFGREFNNRTYNAPYNATSKIYEVNGTFRAYTPGLKRIDSFCNLTSALNASVTEYLNMGSTPAEIRWLGITANGTFFNMSNNTRMEYYNGTYNFSVVIEGFNIQNYSIWIGNSSRLIQAFTDVESILLPSYHFRDFEANPFYINISVQDIYGNVTKRILFFNNTDTAIPTQTGFINVTAANGTTYYWNITFYDQSIYGFNITCSNGFNRSVTGWSGITEYTWSNESMIIGSNISCTLIYCDGHTGELLLRPWQMVKNTSGFKLRNGPEYVEFWSEGLNGSSVKMTDRYSFNLAWPKDGLSTRTIYYRSSGTSQYLPESSYPGHIVGWDTKTWFDVAPFKGRVEAFSADNIVWELTLTDTAKTPITALTMESIGELNCVSETMYFTSIPSKDRHTTLQIDQCPTTVEGALVLMVVIGFMIGMFLLNMAWIRLPAFNIIIGLGFIFLSWTLVGCSLAVGLVGFCFGIFTILLSFFR